LFIGNPPPTAAFPVESDTEDWSAAVLACHCTSLSHSLLEFDVHFPIFFITDAEFPNISTDSRKVVTVKRQQDIGLVIIDTGKY